MRQRNEIEPMSRIFGGKGRPDDGIEFVAGHELANGQFAHGDDELRLQKIELRFQPVGAIQDFIRIGDAIAATGFFSGKATADRRHIDPRAKGRFVDSGMFIEPSKKLFPGRPGEGAAQNGFLVAGGLSHEHDATEDGASADHRLMHLGTLATAQQGGDMAIQPGLQLNLIHDVHERTMRLGAW